MHPVTDVEPEVRKAEGARGDRTRAPWSGGCQLVPSHSPSHLWSDSPPGDICSPFLASELSRSPPLSRCSHCSRTVHRALCIHRHLADQATDGLVGPSRGTSLPSGALWCPRGGLDQFWPLLCGTHTSQLSGPRSLCHQASVRLAVMVRGKAPGARWAISVGSSALL